MSKPGEQLSNADERGDNAPDRLEAASAASTAGTAASEATVVSHVPGRQAPAAPVREADAAAPAFRRQASEGS